MRTGAPRRQDSAAGSRRARDTAGARRARDAAALLPVLGVFLLMPPVITLFSRAAAVAGIPLIVVYVFGVWLALIVCAARLVRRLDPPVLPPDVPLPPGVPLPTDARPPSGARPLLEARPSSKPPLPRDAPL